MSTLKKTIYLVRHGSTAYNDADLLQGHTDHPLNKKGKQEVRSLAETLKNADLDVIFCSPLKRARQTAKAINHYHQITVKIVEDLIEIDLGDWEGKEYSQIQQKYKNTYIKWIKDSEAPIPGGESFSQVFRRVKPGITSILKTPYKNILIVGHATVNRCILGHLLSMTPKSARKFRMRNAAISRFLQYENPEVTRMILDFWNHTTHLGEML